MLEEQYHAVSAAEWAVSSHEARKLAHLFESNAPSDVLRATANRLKEMYKSGFTCEEVRKACDERGLQQLSLNDTLCVFYDTCKKQILVMRESGEYLVYDADRLLHSRATACSDSNREGLAALQQASEQIVTEIVTDESSPKRARTSTATSESDSEGDAEGI
jgi:hypothetical protein